MKGFRQGKKLFKADVNRRIEAFNKKIEEYNLLDLETLTKILPTLKGAYMHAAQTVAMQKTREAQQKIAETSNKLEATEDKGFTEEEIIEKREIEEKT